MKPGDWWSLPTRERGLKCRSSLTGCRAGRVAPYTGAWIEIPADNGSGGKRTVAPYTGAWIEIIIYISLKFCSIVAPYTGAWIEIAITTL